MSKNMQRTKILYLKNYKITLNLTQLMCLKMQIIS